MEVVSKLSMATLDPGEDPAGGQLTRPCGRRIRSEAGASEGDSTPRDRKRPRSVGRVWFGQTAFLSSWSAERERSDLPVVREHRARQLAFADRPRRAPRPGDGLLAGDAGVQDEVVIDLVDQEVAGVVPEALPQH